MLVRAGIASQGYLLKTTGRVTHYMTTNETFTYPWHEMESVGHPKWWGEMVMGVHGVKQISQYTACARHYQPSWQASRHCYTQAANLAPSDQIAKCSRKELPALNVVADSR